MTQSYSTNSEHLEYRAKSHTDYYDMFMLLVRPTWSLKASIHLYDICMEKNKLYMLGSANEILVEFRFIATLTFFSNLYTPTKQC